MTSIQRTNDLGSMMTVRDFADIAHQSYADAKKIIAGSQIAPALVLPWGTRQITYYSREQLMPLAKEYERKYHQRKADLLAKAAAPAPEAPTPAPAQEPETPGYENARQIKAKLDVLASQLADIRAELRDFNDLAAIIASLKVVPEQNRGIFAKLQELAAQQTQLLDAITSPEPTVG